MTLLLFCAVTALFCLVGMDAGWSGETRGMGLTEPALESIDRLGGFFADDVENRRYYRLVTGTLFHTTWLEFILAAAFIFWSISRQAEKICGPLTTLIAYVLGGAAGNAAIALALSGGHTYLPPFGGVIFGLVGAMLGCLLRYRSVFPKEVFASLLKGTLFWIALVTILMFFAFAGTWHFLLDIPAGLFAGGICGLIFPVRKFEREAPIGGTVLKYLCFAGVVAALLGGFLQSGGGEGGGPGLYSRLAGSEYVNGEAGFAMHLPKGVTVQAKESKGKNVTIIAYKRTGFSVIVSVAPFDGPAQWAESRAQVKKRKRIRELKKQSDSITGVHFVDAGVREVDNVEGFMYQIVYNQVIPDSSGGQDDSLVQWREYYYLFINSEREYGITVSYPDVEPSRSVTHERLKLQMLNSLRFLPKQP
jgi:membrane associated rhomboid family serine protease